MRSLAHIISILLFFCKFAYSSDTLKVMHYNLMYYDKNTSYCTSTNNNVDAKDANLSITLSSYKPDIFTANEINGSISSVQRILTNTLNINGITYYKRGNYQGDYLVNMLYYNSNKLVLKSQTYVVTSPRLTDIYNLYLKTDNLVNGDTIFLTCFVTHLKAGSTEEDAAERTTAATQIMNYINSRNIKGNVLIMGDFNLYTSTEGAFQKFTTTTTTGFRFFDPADAVGSWQNNSVYSDYHTQSTHTSSDCFSGGGMDDRFDFILSSLDILQPGGLSYINNSYWAYGQDGNRFNQALTSSSNPNTSLPSAVITALFNMSDHIPITMKLAYNGSTTGIDPVENIDQVFRINSQLTDKLEIFYLGSATEKISVRFVNIMGITVHHEKLLITPGQTEQMYVRNINPGLYLVVINCSKEKYVYRVIKY